MSKEDYEDCVRFVAQEKHMNNSEIFYNNVQFGVWHAGSDEREEGKFTNWYTNEPMPYLPWKEDRPYTASTTYNYIMSLIRIKTVNETKEVEKAHIEDYQDGSLNSPVCTKESKTLIFKLRGLCADFSFDRAYVYTIDGYGQEVFLGHTNSMIKYNSTAKLWHLFKPADNSSLITSAADWNSYLIGLNQVSFEKAKEENCHKGELLQNIKFTTCTTGFFTCNDGRCIPMHKRCDQTMNCKDKSDENNCKLIIMESYNKNIAPFTVNQSNDEIKPVDVNINANVINILKINEVEQSFQLKIALSLNWFDYRLIYHNLKDSRMANSPTREEVEQLWIPSVIFDNTEHNDVMTLDSLAKVTISKEGTSTPSDVTSVDEIDIFDGSENKVYFDRGFTKTVECIYQLQLYPFDTQECTLNLQVGEYEATMINLVPKSIYMKSQTLLTQFFITDWKLEYKKKGKRWLIS